MKIRMLACVILSLGLGVLELLAVPTVHWNSLPNRRQNGYSGWYQGPQAVGTDCVVVKVDIANGPTGSFSAFSWKGSGGGNATVYSDANYSQSPASTGVQIYRAVAEDSSGNVTAPIYWIVKTFDNSSTVLNNSRGLGYTIGFADLPVKANGARLFPNLDQDERNATLYTDVILSLADNGATGKVIEFDPVTYLFALFSGQTWALAGTANLTLRSSSAGQATLKWYHSSNSPTAEAHSFLSLAADAVNITVDNLTFDTTYTARQTDGTHIKIWASHVTVSNCHFYHAPGYALVTAADFVGGVATIPHDVHFDANTIANTFSDGIHVQAGTAIYIVGNVISGTGDDGIAVINDHYFTSGQAAYQAMPSDIHILSNYVEYSGWRGIVLQSTRESEVDSNQINITAQHGLEISPLYGASSAGDFPRRIAVTNNAIWHAGWTPAHPNQPLPDSGQYYHRAFGVYLDRFNQAIGGVAQPTAVCSGNAVRYHSGDSVSIYACENVQFGNTAWIGDAGQPLTLGGNQQWADSWYYGSQSLAISASTNVSGIPY
jgi:hypothetical protein